MITVAPSDSMSRAERLDRLPSTRRHGRLPGTGGILESKRRIPEAERTVRRFEEAASMPAPRVRPDPPTDDASTGTTTDASPPAVDVIRVSIRSPGLRRRTLALWTVWFCINVSYYGAFIWVPSLLVGQGFTLVRWFEFTLIITLAQLPGYAAAAFLIETWGAARRSPSSSPGRRRRLVRHGIDLGAWGALYAVGPELYPANVRGSGTGAAAGRGLSVLRATRAPGPVAGPGRRLGESRG